MSATASWARNHVPEILWALFAAVNFAVLSFVHSWETVPFHFIWVSLTLVYGFRVWGITATLVVLLAVCAVSMATYGWLVINGPQGIDELTEIPLMAAMFVAMVWHAQRRQAALLEVRKAAEREREFVRDASHQLKTPVALARGFADLIRGDPGSEKLREDIADLLEELHQIGRVADDMLVLAAAEQPGNLVLARLDAEDLVVAAARRWSRTADRDWRVNSGIQGVLVGDRQRLDAALDAVIDNAVQATRNGDRITIQARAEAQTAVIVVDDAGVGIPADALQRVFDRFWSIRSDPERKRGTGLGLSIVKAIVEAHGGTVAVQSSQATGTGVTIRLPGLAIDDAVIDAAVPFVVPNWA
jgi:two-component system, OmpR family, sensor kinase